MAWVVSAVVTAFEVTTVASVLTAVAAVGTASTVVGAVTGNKNLMKYGGMLGVVGGVGGLINSGLSSIGATAAAEGIGEAGAAAAGDAATSAIADSAAATGASALDGASSFAGSGLDSAASGIEAANSAVGGSSNALGSLGSTTGSSFNAGTGTGIGNAIDASTDKLLNPISSNVSNATDFASSVNNTPLTRELAATQNTFGLDTGTGITGNNTLLEKLGSQWSNLSPQTKAELLKAGLAIPGGIQNQQNKEAELDLQRQRLAQTSYGSAVPKFGIINQAQQKGG